jgi:hypothetical protein
LSSCSLLYSRITSLNVAATLKYLGLSWQEQVKQLLSVTNVTYHMSTTWRVVSICQSATTPFCFAVDQPQWNLSLNLFASYIAISYLAAIVHSASNIHY